MRSRAGVVRVDQGTGTERATSGAKMHLRLSSNEVLSADGSVTPGTTCPCTIPTWMPSSLPALSRSVGPGRAWTSGISPLDGRPLFVE